MKESYRGYVGSDFSSDGKIVFIGASSPSGWESEDFDIPLTIDEAKDFLKCLQEDIEAAEKIAKKIEKEKKAAKAKEAA